MIKPELIQIVRRYLHVIQEARPFSQLQAFYHPNATQIEYPNLLTKTTKESNVEALGNNYEKGKKVLKKQAFEIIKQYQSENTVIIEAIWRGQLAVAIGPNPDNLQMKAYFAQFFEFEGDKIIRQRNYDCFES